MNFGRSIESDDKCKVSNQLKHVQSTTITRQEAPLILMCNLTSGDLTLGEYEMRYGSSVRIVDESSFFGSDLVRLQESLAKAYKAEIPTGPEQLAN